MDNLYSLVADCLMAAATACLVLAVALLVLRRMLRGPRSLAPATRDAQQDLPNMMILFQTMRDILDQQKQLARELNKSLDQRVTHIRGHVKQAMDNVDDLRRSVETLRQQIEAAQARMEMPRDTARVAPAPSDAGTPATAEPAPAIPSAPQAPAVQLPEPEPERPVLRILAKPRDPATRNDIIENWVGLDFGGDEPDPLPFEVPEDVPEEPGDAEAAREAFRALLNLEENADDRLGLGEPDDADAARAGGGNGQKQASPLHARICEYSDAGMTVPQIARELGMGKGEVRLVLSLRKSRSR
jgi:hypothetical protein